MASRASASRPQPGAGISGRGSSHASAGSLTIQLAADQPLQVEADGTEAELAKGLHQLLAQRTSRQARQGERQSRLRQLDPGGLALAAHPQFAEALLAQPLLRGGKTLQPGRCDRLAIGEA